MPIAYPGYDLQLPDVDPWKYLDTMPTENPFVWKDDTMAGPDIAGGLGKTMKSIYAKRLLDDLQKKNEERFNKQYGQNQQALDANIKYGDPMYEQNARAGMAPNYYKDPEDQGNFVLGQGHEYQAPTDQEQDLKRFWDIAMTFGYEQGGQPMPQEMVDEIWNRVLKEKNFGSGYYSVQAAEKRGNAAATGKETTAQVFAAIDDQLAKGLITPEMAQTMKQNHIRGAGKTEGATNKGTKVDQDRILNETDAKLQRGITQINENGLGILKDPKTGEARTDLTAKEVESLTIWKMRKGNLKKIIDAIAAIKKSKAVDGTYNVSPGLWPYFDHILDQATDLSMENAGKWIQQFIASLDSEAAKQAKGPTEKQALGPVK